MVKFEKIYNSRRFLKILIFGTAGVGKTHFSLSFKNPAIIDMESGSTFMCEKFKNALAFHTKSFSELCDAVTEVEKNIDTLKINTLIIDPITVAWASLLDSRIEAKKIKMLRNNPKADFDNLDLSFTDWASIKRKYNSFITTCLNLPVHLILVARAKDEYKVELVGGVMQPSKIGIKANCEKETSYVTDLVLRMEFENGQRYISIEKDRTGTFEIGQKISNPTYEFFEKNILLKYSKSASEPKQELEEVVSTKDAEKELIRENKLQEIYEGFKNCTTAFQLKTLTDEVEKRKNIFTSSDLEMLRQEYIRKHKEIPSNHNLIPAGV